jgi:hypothetical protein
MFSTNYSPIFRVVGSNPLESRRVERKCEISKHEPGISCLPR